MDRALQSVLAWWDVIGVDIPEVKPPAVRRAPKQMQSLQRDAAPQTAATKPPKTLPSSGAAEGAKTLDELKKVIAEFDAGEISDHARQAVFSRGNPDADIMVIGEAPGRDEDMQGKPFVGRSGQLLDRMFAAIGLTEEHIYITNVVNWRPPNNRNPNTEELLLCKPLIQRHMELFNPKIIVLVGGISFSALTGKNGIMKNRGQWLELSVNGKSVPTLPIYHPAFLLRQSALKKDAWRDLLSLRERIDALT